jgi:hypothetical protein
MPDDEPLSHIRRPDLPWRTSRLTECGRPTADVKKFMERQEALALVKKHGIKRAAFLLCMTCMTTANQYRTWEEDPAGALAREFFGATDPKLSEELRALGALVNAHREEFDGFLEGLGSTVDLAAARRQRARRIR